MDFVKVEGEPGGMVLLYARQYTDDDWTLVARIPSGEVAMDIGEQLEDDDKMRAKAIARGA